MIASVLLALALAAPAAAQEPAEPGVRFYALAAGEVTLGGNAEPTIRPAAEIEVDGPLAIGARAPARVFARFRTFGLPGETVDLSDVKTFRAAELTVGAYRRVGLMKVGEQELWTSLEGEWGFATALPADGEEASLRYPRRYGVGIRSEERTAGAWLSILYGRHESAGPRGWGQWLVSGGVPLGFTKSAIVLGGDAVLSVGPAVDAEGGARRDLLKLYVGVSLPDLAQAFRR